MPGINNIGSRTGKLVMTSTPKGNGWASVSASMYQKNQKNETDPKGKLVIQNYNRDLTSAVFYGWDLISSDELEDSYVFQLVQRENSKFRVYITLSRQLQEPGWPASEMFYQCYIHDDAGAWSKTVWLNSQSINYMKFWNMIESVVDEYHPILPF